MTVHTPDTDPTATRSPGHAAATPGFTSTLAAEWRKLWSLRSTYVIFAVMIVITVGVSGIMSVFGGGENLAKVQSEGTYDVIFFGATLGVWAFTFVGAGFVASEFTGKLAEYTFVATPRRSRVLAAKLAIIAGLGLVSGLLISLANVAITQTALSVAGYATLDLGDPGLWRAVLIYIALSMAVQGTLVGLFAVLVRNSFGAVAIVILALNALPVTLAQFLGDGYRNTVPRLMPGAAVESVAGLSPVTSAGHLSLFAALGVLVVWLGVLSVLAFRRLLRSDAR